MYEVKFYSWKMGIFSLVRHPTSLDSRNLLKCFIKTGRTSNFGDELTGYLLTYFCKSFGLKIVRTSLQKANFIGIGSILSNAFFFSKNGAVIWGAGFKKCPDQNYSAKDCGKFHFLSVRGFLTLNHLELLGNVTVGDPGLLLRRTVNKDIQKKRDILIIPHFSAVYKFHNSSSLLKNVALDIKVSYPTKQVKKILCEIQESKIVVSSSLHVLIAADSLQVPAVRLIDDSHIREGDFKFQDYLSSISDFRGWPQIELKDIDSEFLIKFLQPCNLRSIYIEPRIIEVIQKAENLLLDYFDSLQREITLK